MKDRRRGECEPCKDVGYPGEPGEMRVTDHDGRVTYVCAECYHDGDLGTHPDVCSVDEVQS